MAEFDFCIAGGGVVGLAIARALSRSGSVLLAEKNDLFGSETSSRNSEVIHAGLYYPAGSLKERLCLQGKALLYDFCDRHNVPYRRTGKLIIAPTANHPKIQALQTTAARLNIPLQYLDQHALTALEPDVQGQCALLSPTTGIIDSHHYMQTLAQLAQANNALLMRQTHVSAARAKNNHWQIDLQTSDGPYQTSASVFINATGLHAQQLASQSDMNSADIPPLYPCRGHYFSYSGKAPFSHLIYPLPEDNLTGLGIHATLDLSGQVRFGPDTQYLHRNQIDDYQVPTERESAFYAAIRNYFPGIDRQRLHADYAGIRPKLHSASQPAADFDIRLTHVTPAAIHLFGIESPGLTSSLAIAQEVTELLQMA